MFLIVLIPVVLVFICAFKESKVTAVYKAFGVYGRFSAFITMSFILAAVASLTGGILSMVFFPEEYENSGILEVVYTAAQSAIVGAFGIYLFKRTSAKCPQMLRKKLFISMLITAIGVGAKICAFFLPIIWKMTGPKEMVDANGKRLLVYNGEVYDENGNHLGTASPDGTSYTPN